MVAKEASELDSENTDGYTYHLKISILFFEQEKRSIRRDDLNKFYFPEGGRNQNHEGRWITDVA